MYSAKVIAPRFCVVVALVALLAFAPTPAAAQGDPRFAVDRFEPSERGSEWFANESLRLLGPTRFRLGAVSSYARRPVVVGDRAPVRELAVVHVGGNVVAWDWLRLSAVLPVQAYAGGRSSGPIPSPPKEQGIGDLRIGIDERVFGRDHTDLRVASGVQVWIPTGERRQWASDGTWRVRPRMMAAGEVKWFAWSGQLFTTLRDGRIGTDVGVALAAGVRLSERVVIGPEVFASTRVDDFMGKRGTPLELLFGAHWLIARAIRVGAGIGRGFTVADGDPDVRLLASIELAPEYRSTRPRRPKPIPMVPIRPPEPPKDEDHDHVPDEVDACPAVAGIPSADPTSNGCPPDTDGDLVNDLGDACPTQPGPATTDPETTGCPPAKEE